MGRNKLSEEDKKQGIYIKLAPWVKKWLKEQGRSQGGMIEEALIYYYGIERPEEAVK